MSIEQLNILYINYISDQFDFFFWYSTIVTVIVNYVH